MESKKIVIDSTDKYPIKVEILITTNREITEKEYDDILYSHAEEIVRKIRTQSMILDPKVQKDAAEEKEELLSLFPKPIYVKEIPNEYNKNPFSPWFIVTTHEGPIKIGWRKRVIHIDWSESDILETTDILFKDEDVTKGDKYIHAWGYHKAKEYIDKLMS
jgi:hypothetical protein